MTTISARKPRKKASKPAKKPDFVCEYCKKHYINEGSFMVHMCSQKQRMLLDRDQQYVKIGYMAFQKFYELSFNIRKPKTYTEFAESRYYTDFTRFGKYILNINAIAPLSFVEFLVKTAIPIKNWQSPVVYETYIRELSKKETPDAAIERNILLMQQWAMDTGNHWSEFFRLISPSLATLWIRSGRISPWVLFIANSASTLFSRLSDEQLKLVGEYVDPKFWEIKLQKHEDDVKMIRTILDDAGL